MKTTNPNRTCMATKEEKPKDELLRFTLTPDRRVIPDFKKKLPGRGFYLANSRRLLEKAIAKRLFVRLGKKTIVDENLPDMVENLLKTNALNALNLARKAGVLVTGFEKVKENLNKGKVAFLLQATDAGSDGRSKIAAAAGKTEILTLFKIEELDKALNRVNTVHAALLQSKMADMAYSQLKKWQIFINS